MARWNARQWIAAVAGAVVVALRGRLRGQQACAVPDSSPTTTPSSTIPHG